MHVLVTGAAGSIGRVVLPGLAEAGHSVAGVDLVTAPEGTQAPWHVADCTDPGAVRAVFEAEARAGRPVEAVVHLAGMPHEGALAAELDSHVVSTASLAEAMVAHGARRMVYASSNHAIGNTERSASVGVDVASRPDTFYGVAKVAAEALLRLYADRHALDVVSCRIGSFLDRPGSLRALSTWLSPGDCVRMVEAALTTPDPGFAVLWGISANTRAWWDLSPGRALGYDPQDDAEDFAGDIEPRGDDEAEAARVGGPFTLPAIWRPAFD